MALISVVSPSLLIPDIWEFGLTCSLQCSIALSIAWKSPIAFIGCESQAGLSSVHELWSGEFPLVV